MSMAILNINCIYDDSDEDCMKCSKHGYRYNCNGCADGFDLFGNPIKEEGWWDDEE